MAHIKVSLRRDEKFRNGEQIPDSIGWPSGERLETRMTVRFQTFETVLMLAA